MSCLNLLVDTIYNGKFKAVTVIFSPFVEHLTTFHCINSHLWRHAVRLAISVEHRLVTDGQTDTQR